MRVALRLLAAALIAIASGVVAKLMPDLAWTVGWFAAMACRWIVVDMPDRVVCAALGHRWVADKCQPMDWLTAARSCECGAHRPEIKWSRA